MKLVDRKTRATAFVSAVALMAIGFVTTTPVDAQETKNLVEFGAAPPGEAEMIREVANLTRELQFKRKKNFASQGGQTFRGVHPKSHGCVAADFTVLNYIGHGNDVGLFAKPGTYEAMIRYSNASVLVLGDLLGGNGSRGMAIKVFDVDGPIVPASKDERNQDFLMINTPSLPLQMSGITSDCRAFS